MHWVVQNNLFQEPGFHELLAVLERMEIPHTVVKCIPFGGGTEPEIHVPGPIVVMGSLTLTRHAQARGWTPGAFLNERFDFEIWREHLGEALLNADARVYRLADVPVLPGGFFIRPCLEGKAFSGKVMDGETFAGWREAVLSPDHPGAVDADTRVAVSRLKPIQAEYRTVVVDGRVITGSLYKLGGRVVYVAELEPEVRAFAQRVAERWGPDRAYVMDVFRSEGELFVGEFNTLNSAGFYAYNVGRMVEALEGMGF